jgi:hypothetical protein
MGQGGRARRNELMTAMMFLIDSTKMGYGWVLEVSIPSSFFFSLFLYSFAPGFD